MNIIGLFIAAGLVLLGVISKQTESPQVLSAQNGAVPVTPETSETPSPTPSPSVTVTPTATVRATATPTATPTPSQSAAGSSLRYPNSKVVEESGSRIKLESTDTDEQVTDWYKRLLEEKHMNAKSIVQTKTNGRVLNKLAGSNGDEAVEISIERDSETAVVKIVIKITDR